MREIKFRAQDIASNKWLCGDIRHHKNDVCIFEQGGNRGEQVKPETVGQFTGLHDKNGKEIYEGDIIAFYELKTYCINPDCEPHLLGYSERLHKKIKVVRFEDGIFGVDGEYLPIEVLSGLGEWGADEEFMTELKNDPYFDANGYDLGSVAGVEIIGNIHDNKSLLEGGEQ